MYSTHAKNIFQQIVEKWVDKLFNTFPLDISPRAELCIGLYHCIKNKKVDWAKWVNKSLFSQENRPQKTCYAKLFS